MNAENLKILLDRYEENFDLINNKENNEISSGVLYVAFRIAGSALMQKT
jgi:hypothetical protein